MQMMQPAQAMLASGKTRADERRGRPRMSQCAMFVNAKSLPLAVAARGGHHAGKSDIIAWHVPGLYALCHQASVMG